MSKPPIVQFIEENRASGKSDTEISHMLLDAGWQMDVINKAMHGEPIQPRSLDPILDIRKQPYRKSFLIIVIAVVLTGLLLLAAFIPL